MSAALDRYTALLGDGNIRAFLHVIREGESSHDDSAYTVINGGSHFPAPPWRHPYDGVPTTQGGKASGAYEFLGTTWRGCADALGLGSDFSPASQDAAAVYLIDRRHALAQVMAGQVLAACALLADEWVSLPHLGAERIKRVFQAYGGKLAAQTSPGAAIPAQDGPTPQPEPKPAPAPDPGPQRTPEGKPMPALALLQLFAPILGTMIPQIANLLKPNSEIAQRNVGIAEVVLNTINQATGRSTLQGSIESMSADKELQAKVQQAVVAHPDIINTLEITEGLVPVGGGPQAVRDFNAQMNADQRPWWTFLANASFWIALFLSPLLYMVVYQVLWGDGSSEQLKTVVVTAILSGLLGALTGYFFGSAYASTRTARTATTTTASGTGTTTSS